MGEVRPEEGAHAVEGAPIALPEGNDADAEEAPGAEAVDLDFDVAVGEFGFHFVEHGTEVVNGGLRGAPVSVIRHRKHLWGGKGGAPERALGRGGEGTDGARPIGDFCHRTECKNTGCHNMLRSAPE